MIRPYTAVGLVPAVRGIRSRHEITVNIEHLSHMAKAAAWLSSLELAVRLIALPEGALQGFNDEVLDLDHVEFAKECAIDIPGRETEALGVIAREYNAFIMAQAKARHPDWKDRYFNVGFILDPAGEVILRHYKVSPLFPVEHSVCPNARALAMNGAEVVYRGSYPHPASGNGFFEIQSRARALDNNMYIVAPNMGAYYLHTDSDLPIDTFGGRSFIIDYRGQIVGSQVYGGVSTYVAGVIDIEALRYHRDNAQWDNWLKDLRTELYQLLYKEPIYPKNLYLEREPMKHAEYRKEVIEKQIALMHQRGIWKKSSYQ